MPGEALLIEGRAAQLDLAVGGAPITVVAPVFARQRLQVERPAAEAAEILERCLGLWPVEVLEHALADHEIEASARRVIDDRGAPPAELAAQVLADLDPDIARARVMTRDHLAPVAEAAT